MKNCILCKDHKFCPEWKTVQVNIRNEVMDMCGITDKSKQICQLAFINQGKYNAGELNAGMEMAGNCSDFVTPSRQK